MHKLLVNSTLSKNPRNSASLSSISHQSLALLQANKPFTSPVGHDCTVVPHVVSLAPDAIVADGSGRHPIDRVVGVIGDGADLLVSDVSAGLTPTIC